MQKQCGLMTEACKNRWETESMGTERQKRPGRAVDLSKRRCDAFF